MQKINHSIILVLICFQFSFAQDFASVIVFPDDEKAQSLLQKEDDFTKSWSSFDVQSRLGDSEGTKAELLALIPKEVLTWREKEKTRIKDIAAEIDAKAKELGWDLRLPDTIYIVKTSGNEEGGAEGYTRSNYIVLKEEAVRGKEKALEHLLSHELFHIISRANPKLRAELYALIGFNIMTPIKYPEEIADLRITNPDATQTDTYISLKLDGKEQDAMMVLYAKDEYSGGSFFEYLQIGFLALDENQQVLMEDGAAKIYGLREAKGFFEQIGRNTQYIIHPEEILAENFSMALWGNKAPSPKIIAEIQRIMKKAS